MMGMYIFTVATAAVISFVAGLAIGTKFGPKTWQWISDEMRNLPNAG